MVSFCDDNKWVQLAVCECCITVQCLVNEIRTYEPGLNFMDDAKIIDATGKEDIGGGQFTAITMTMQNGWEIRAHCGYACQTNVVIRGGNLAFICGTPPVVPVTNVTYVIGNSTSPGLSGSVEVDVTKIRRYLTNKQEITCCEQQIFCDCGGSTVVQRYTLDDECAPKSKDPTCP